MKKAIVLVVAALMSLALVGCGGGDDQTSANVAAAPDSALSGTASKDVASTEEADKAAVQDAAAQGSASGAESGSAEGGSDADAVKWTTPLGTYIAYDRFSGDKANGVQLVLRELNSDSIVIDYTSPSANWSKVTVPIDANGFGSVEQGGVTLDITLGDDFIQVDEIEGLGAMAYVFR